MPEKYLGIGSDEFMAMLIEKYAVEGGKANKKPNGEFWMEWNGAERASRQVLQDYLHITEEHAADIVCGNFKATWQYFDINNEGKLPLDRMPNFFRHIVGNEVHLNL